MHCTLSWPIIDIDPHYIMNAPRITYYQTLEMGHFQHFQRWMRLSAVAGGWSQWSSWSGCSATCGSGDSSRIRSCNNPPPQFNGDDCTGNSADHQACNLGPCSGMLVCSRFSVFGCIKQILMFSVKKSIHFPALY